MQRTSGVGGCNIVMIGGVIERWVCGSPTETMGRWIGGGDKVCAMESQNDGEDKCCRDSQGSRESPRRQSIICIRRSRKTDNTVSELIWQDVKLTHDFKSGEAVGEGGKALGG